MASAKKRRGRERKAARKKDNNGGGRTVSTDGGVVSGGIDIDSSTDWVVVTEGVRLGHDFSTSRANGLYGSQVHDRQHLIRAGLLDVTLGYLARCNASFDSVMRDIGGDLVLRYNTPKTPDLESPIKWLELLVTIANNSRECHSQIIDGIGPLVRCMCDDAGRKFFGSKKYWHEAILQFIWIIYKMLELESSFIQLSQYEELFEMIVQSWFWQSNRPDIFNEFNNFASTSDIPVTIISEDFKKNYDPSTTMTVLGAFVSFRLLEWAAKNDDARNMLREIGSVPIVSRSYDPNCKVSLVGGIIRHMKKSGDRKAIAALTALVGYADCVDKDGIIEMIDYGYNFTSEYDDANVATTLLLSMITRKIDNVDAAVPNDSRAAFAIRAGLLEICMGMIARFGGDKNTHGTMFSVSSILRNIYILSFHKKTWKAIGDKRGHLIEEFELLKENKQVTSNESNRCKLAMSIIQSIIDITSTSCFVCNKETERRDMKKCATCRSVCYCSEECQRKDWHSGDHTCACNNIINGCHQILLPNLRGNYEREIAKLKGLERNIMMAQKSLFLRHAETIREQLAAKQSPQTEYLVRFDLFKCPPAVTVIPYTEYFVSGHLKKWFKENVLPAEENLMCVYESPFFIGNSNEVELPEGLIVYNLFPRVVIIRGIGTPFIYS